VVINESQKSCTRTGIDEKLVVNKAFLANTIRSVESHNQREVYNDSLTHSSYYVICRKWMTVGDNIIYLRRLRKTIMIVVVILEIEGKEKILRLLLPRLIMKRREKNGQRKR
jgi:hypothetical protein